MRKSLVAVILLLSTQLSGCFWATFPYSPGIIYTSHDIPHKATTNETGEKSAQVCTTNILGLISTGDSSVQQAAKKGNIDKISSVDIHFETVLGLFSKSCTKVSGN